MKRRLAAILVADVAGYSSLMEADEEGTAARMAACRALADAEIGRADGRVFKSMGDAVLAEFASPMNALHCAVAIRDALALAERDREAPLTMRFGLHLADVMVEGDDLIGDGVNLAARIQQAAEPGAVELSAAMFEQIRRTSPYAFEDLGEQRFRNIAEPLRVYRLRGEMRRHPCQIAHTQPAPRPAKRPYSLAVMPFEVAAGEEDRHFLAEGLAEELILELGRFRKLFVTARSATRALEGMADPQSVGERLGVRYVLTGSVRQLGPRMRLALTLTETESGTVVWSDRLSQSFEELIEGLDALVSRIAATVLGRVEESDIAAARRMKPESMTAFECHLRGLEYHRLGGVTDENMHQAMDWFRRAIEADENFARPWAMLTCSWSNLPDFDLAEGTRNVERALELDPNDPEANRIMGSIKMGDPSGFEAARYYHEKAMELSPSDAYIKGRSAAFYSFVGEPERALKLLDEAEALDPFLPVWCVEERLVALYGLGRHEEAVAAGRSLPFQTRRSRLYRAAAHVALGNLERARQLVAEAVAATPDLSVAYVRQKESYRDQEAKRRLIERLEEAGLPRFASVAEAS